MDTIQLYNIARSYIGLEEYPGAKHNPAILAMYAASGNGWVEDDETPWCAAFVGSVLAQAGIKNTGSLAARSYMEWGEEVPLEEAQPGDIVVLWRTKPNSWQGHVAFFDNWDGENGVYLIGGNQGNAVSRALYPRDRILSIRRPKAPRAHPSASTTIQASVTQIGAATAGGVTAIAALDGVAQLVALGAATVVLVGAMVVFRERLAKWRAGDR